MMISVLIYNFNEPLPKQGGMERVTDSLAKGLTARGIRVILLCRKRNRLGARYIAPCPIYFVPDSNQQEYIRRLLADKKITHIIDQTEGGIVGRFGYFKKKDKCFDGIRLIAVQHSSSRAIMNNFEIAVMPDIQSAIVSKIYRQSILRLRKLHSKHLIKKLYKELDLNYDKIVVLSPSFIDDFLYLSPKTNRDKLIAIPNMNTYNDVGASCKEKSVLFVGRLVSRVKGCDKLLRIWKEASAGLDDWRLDIVGNGPDRESLEAQAATLNLTNYKFHGFNKPDFFYQRAEIFCLTSIYEGFGMVLTEAMQHGVVPIAFNSYSASADIIDNGKTGVLITPFDEHDYAVKLRKLMLSPSLREQYRANASESVKRFSTENVLYQWKNLIEQTS